MNTMHRLLSILVCILLFTLSACGNHAPAPSNGNSQTDSSDKDGNTESEQIMTEEEIIAVFTDLDSKAKDLLKWVQKNYTKIPLDGVPLHEVENMVVGLKVVSPDPEQPDVGGFAPVYGTAVLPRSQMKQFPISHGAAQKKLQKRLRMSLKMCLLVTSSNSWHQQILMSQRESSISSMTDYISVPVIWAMKRQKLILGGTILQCR